jgi:hypothetical protein
MRACLRAKAAWEAAPAVFRIEPQLELFDQHRYSLLEVVKGRRADRRRRRRSTSQS